MITMTRLNGQTVIGVVYEIDGEHFVWVFEPARKMAARFAVVKMVLNPKVYFTWHDAANVYQLINMAIAQTEMGK
jgi:hypothetical protein